MENPNIFIDKSFLISKEASGQYLNKIPFGEYIFHYNDAEVTFLDEPGKTLIIHGFVVDSSNGEADQNVILNYLFKYESFSEVIRFSKKLAGHFVIVYYARDGLYILPDATSSITVGYTVQNRDLLVSTEPSIIARIKNYKESSLSTKILSQTTEGHSLPYDLTMYDEIKYITPNHYLNCNTGAIVRFFPSEKRSSISINEAVNKSSLLIKNIITAYRKRYKLAVSLTSGMDSRLILSFCKDFIGDIPTFIYRHDYMTDNTGDLVVPKLMAKELGFQHIIINDKLLPQNILDQCKSRLGYELTSSEVRNAWTHINSELKLHYRLDGNIAPIAKSGFGKRMPEVFATSSYLNTKTHIYSIDSYRVVRRWKKDVQKKAKKSNISKFDLFFWEHRSGRWTSRSYKNFNLLSNTINPFNCRELLEVWVNIPRRERVIYSLHKEIIKKNWPELLDFPINPDAKYKFISRSSILFYFASYLKYFLNFNRKL